MSSVLSQDESELERIPFSYENNLDETSIALRGKESFNDIKHSNIDINEAPLSEGTTNIKYTEEQEIELSIETYFENGKETGVNEASFKENKYNIRSPLKPYMPEKVRDKIEKMRKTSLKRDEMVKLIEDIGKIAEDFYEISPNKFIAVNIEGRVVEYAETEIELLLKIQGRRFDTPVFLIETGEESAPGWLK